MACCQIGIIHLAMVTPLPIKSMRFIIPIVIVCSNTSCTSIFARTLGSNIVSCFYLFGSSSQFGIWTRRWMRTSMGCLVGLVVWFHSFGLGYSLEPGGGLVHCLLCLRYSCLDLCPLSTLDFPARFYFFHRGSLPKHWSTIVSTWYPWPHIHPFCVASYGPNTMSWHPGVHVRRKVRPFVPDGIWAWDDSICWAGLGISKKTCLFLRHHGLLKCPIETRKITFHFFCRIPWSLKFSNWKLNNRLSYFFCMPMDHLGCVCISEQGNALLQMFMAIICPVVMFFFLNLHVKAESVGPRDCPHACAHPCRVCT